MYSKKLWKITILTFANSVSGKRLDDTVKRTIKTKIIKSIPARNVTFFCNMRSLKNKKKTTNGIIIIGINNRVLTILINPRWLLTV
jgi:hypothetical protein